MASSASTLFKVELQAAGENDSVWGDKVNDLVERLEEAVGGRAAIVVTVADVTLTDTQYVANEARNMILDVTGAKTANRNIIVPARTKVYIVNNQSSGAFTLTVKTSGGTGPTIPQGGKSIVFCDGTNVITVVDSSTDAYVPGGTDVAVADGGTGASTESVALDNLGAGATGKAIFQDTTAAAVRAEIGLGTAAVVNTGASNGDVPLVGAGALESRDRECRRRPPHSVVGRGVAECHDR